ncbi:hypothetical protein SAMN04488000_104272 [Lentzea albida]|uniref:Uncharacterized protein n=1 Tax=Lentzea albida TaxID=65499 RepID=A0A1H9IPQ6_9PSEU|nr:hypothetical protein SAMN04488000_104272 [Lentzea albida]
MRNKKRAALVGFPTGGSRSGLTSRHYKELTCANGRDDGRRCGVLVIAVPFRLGVCNEYCGGPGPPSIVYFRRVRRS